jgi:CheY-specific phosphatase CheX
MDFPEQQLVEVVESVRDSMLSVHPTVDDELRRDALGELANMIAGNVKALAPGEEHHISMPRPPRETAPSSH